MYNPERYDFEPVQNMLQTIIDGSEPGALWELEGEVYTRDEFQESLNDGTICEYWIYQTDTNGMTNGEFIMLYADYFYP